MTYRELYDAVAALIPGMFSIRVETWKNGPLVWTKWTIWDSDRTASYDADTPEAALAECRTARGLPVSQGRDAVPDDPCAVASTAPDVAIEPPAPGATVEF